MALPIINEGDSFTQIELLSGKKIGIKPWRIKEERELLFSIEGMEDEQDSKKEIVKFIRKCVDNTSIFDKLSNTDYVYLLVNLRKYSKGAKIEYEYKCTGTREIADKDGNVTIIPCGFKLSDDIHVIDNLVTKKFTASPIVVTDKLTVGIKEVPFTVYDMLRNKYEKTTEYNYHFIINSIDSIVYDGEVYEEFTEEELITFLDHLSSNDFGMLAEAISDAGAEISMSKTLTCGKCKHVNKVEIGELYSFLAL